MPTLRELTGTIQQRPGVRSVVLLGDDGLVIEMEGSAYLDAEAQAARVPAVVAAARQLGKAAQAGEAQFVLLEFDQGYGIVMRLSPQVNLFVSAGAEVALGELLFDLRSHKAPIAELVS